MRTSLLVMVLWICPLVVWGQVSVSGAITNAEGIPMPVAHIEVAPYGGGRFMPARMEAAQQGHYNIALDSIGLYTLRFMGPLHETFDVTVWAADVGALKLDVQLQRAWMDPDQSYTRVLTANHDFSYDDGLALSKQPDGSYTAVIPTPGDTLRYYLEGATRQHYAGLVLADLTASTFRYRGDGDYVALLPSPGDSVTIALTPKRLDSETPPAPVAAFDPASHAGTIWAMIQRLEKASPITGMGMMRLYMGLRDEEESPEERDLKNVMRQEMLALEVAIDQETDGFEREVMLFEYLSRGEVVPIQWWGGRFRQQMGGRIKGPPIKQKYVQQALESIAPTSLLWGLQPALLAYLPELTDAAPETLAYLETAIAEHPMPSVRELTLLNLFHMFFAQEGLTESAAGYLARYKDMTGDRSRFEDFPSDQVRKIVPGRRMSDIGGTSWALYQRFNADSLAGKVALLDFIKADCTACMADVAHLQAAAERYAEQGLQVVRISLDRPTAPTKSADEEPWVTLQGEDGFNSRVALGFEVLRLPHRVLIDLDGVILATGTNLMSDQLAAALRRVFEE